VVDCREPASDTVLLFRNRPENDPVRPHELFLTRVQLTLRELVTDEDFNRFLAVTTQPAA
jgi:hypothetical protein